MPAVETRPFSLDAETLFVLGNGPSLKDVPLETLTPYPSIGMNAAYRHWQRIDWRPTYYACLDTVVGLSHAEGIRGLITERRSSPIRLFLLRHNLVAALGRDADDPRVIDFEALAAGTPLLQVMPITTGSHAALWGAVLGYRKMVVLGVDGRYQELVKGAVRREGQVLEIAEARENPNYFFDDYQRPGDRYHVPNPSPRLHLGAWDGAAAVLARDGAMVVNGNPQSAVTAFPFVPIADLLAGAAVEIPARTSDVADAEIGPDTGEERRLDGITADLRQLRDWVLDRVREHPLVAAAVLSAPWIAAQVGWATAPGLALAAVTLILGYTLIALAWLMFLVRRLRQELKQARSGAAAGVVTEDRSRQIRIVMRGIAHERVYFDQRVGSTFSTAFRPDKKPDAQFPSS
jgi:hypothetical protein